TMRQKYGGHPSWHVEAGRQGVVLFRLQVARIDRNGEIGPATHLVNVIDRLIGALVEVRRGGNCEMASRRKADDADALRVDAPFLGLAAHEAHGALRVLEWTPGRVFTWGIIGTSWHAVLQQNAGYADRVEPGGDFLALKLPPEVMV